MLSQILISGIDIRFIPARIGNTGFEVIRDKDLWDTTEELKGMDMGLNPGGQILGQGSLCKGVIAGPEGCYEDLSFSELPC